MNETYRIEHNALIKKRYRRWLLIAKQFRLSGDNYEATEALGFAAYWREKIIWKV